MDKQQQFALFEEIYEIFWCDFVCQITHKTLTNWHFYTIKIYSIKDKSTNAEVALL